MIRRWGTLDLLDVLKDADFLTEFSTEFTSVASREVIDRDTLRLRLLLCLFAHAETWMLALHLFWTHINPQRPFPARHEHPPRPSPPRKGIDVWLGPCCVRRFSKKM